MTDRQLVALAALTKVLDDWQAEVNSNFYDLQYRRGVRDVIYDVRLFLHLSEPDNTQTQPEQEP